VVTWLTGGQADGIQTSLSKGDGMSKRGRKARIANVGDPREVSQIANHLEINDQQWAELCLQFGNSCALCGNDQDLLPDFVVPLKFGSTRTIENIQPLCADCTIIKNGYLVDYRPFEPLSGTAPEVSADGVQVPKMLTRRHLLAIEHAYSSVLDPQDKQGGVVVDPIVEYDVPRILLAELKRLRVLIVVQPDLAWLESLAWRERYASLMAKSKPSKSSGK
jgi:hypothetical protein